MAGETPGFGAPGGVVNNYYGTTPQSNNTMMGGMTNPDGTPNWAAIISNLATGGYSLYQGLSGNQMDVAREAAAAADPFASQRGQYQTQLSNTLGQGGLPNFYDQMAQSLLTDPTAFKTDPGYQFAVDQGTQAAMRAGNALYGTQRSGAIAPEVAKYVTGYANQAFDTRIGELLQGANITNQGNANLIDQLLMASGAKTGNPAAAGELLGWGNLMQNNAIGSGGSNLLGGVGAALPSILSWIFGGGGGGFSLPNITGTNTIGGGGGGSGVTGTGTIGGGGYNPNWGMNDRGIGPDPGASNGSWDVPGIDWGDLFSGWGGTAADPWYG